jgi:hypothetical protein
MRFVHTSAESEQGSSSDFPVAITDDIGKYCGWIFHPICGGRMYRIDPFVFCNLGRVLARLEEIKPKDELGGEVRALEEAQSELEPVVRDLRYHSIPVPRSTEWAKRLHEILTGLLEKEKASPREIVGGDSVVALRTSVRRLTDELSYDLAEVPFFYVSPKGIYSTMRLLEHATDLFPKEVLDRIPEVVDDWREAGRCLALDLPTAAAFHIFRVVEAVSKKYAITFKGGPLDSTERALGGHLRVLRNAMANGKVIEFLDHFREFHRNPSSHETGLLTQGEVFLTFSVAQGVIQAMVADMERKSTTPDPSVIQLLPDQT